MTGRHRLQRRVPRWIGLTIMALFVVVASIALAPLVRADVMPPGPGAAPHRVPTATSTTCAAQTAGWGSLPKSNPVMVIGPAFDVRAGRHPCYDRLVVDIHGVPAGWSARYVDRFVQDASGQVLPVRGGKIIEWVVRTNGHDIDTGRTILSATDMPGVTGFTTLRSVVYGADFEGQIQLGIGVRALLPFRVFALRGTGGVSHVVLDVAHRW